MKLALVNVVEEAVPDIVPVLSDFWKYQVPWVPVIDAVPLTARSPLMVRSSPVTPNPSVDPVLSVIEPNVLEPVALPIVKVPVTLVAPVTPKLYAPRVRAEVSAIVRPEPTVMVAAVWALADPESAKLLLMVVTFVKVFAPEFERVRL